MRITNIPLWLASVVLATAFCGLVYATVQQSIRQSANDPQIQMAEDGARALEAGAVPAEIVPRTIIGADKSLAPFIAVYDKNGTPLEASASVGGKPPQPPIGVFESARALGENRVTWQPNSETRIALVVRPTALASGWFVASGRNMREIEIREAKTELMALLVWMFTLPLTFLLICVRPRQASKSLFII